MIHLGQVKDVLQAQSVINEIESCLHSRDATPESTDFHFFIYATKQGVYVGKHTQQNGEVLKATQSSAIMRDADSFPCNKEVIRCWKPLADLTLIECKLGYMMNMRENQPIDVDSGLLLLTTLRYDPVTERARENLNKALSSKGKRNDCSMLERMPTLTDYVSLNMLRGAHNSATLARIIIRDKMAPHGSILLLHQKVPEMDDETLSYISAMDSFGHLLPEHNKRAREDVQKTYQKAYGVLDLEQRAVMLDADLVSAR